MPLDTTLSTDRNALLTIIEKLVNNAIKFTHEGGSITINYLKNKNTVELHIIDTGIGITFDVIGKLFKIDEDISTTGTNNEKGIGSEFIIRLPKNNES